MRTTLYERVARAICVCHVFGVGYSRFRSAYILLMVGNLSASVWLYFTVINHLLRDMDQMHDPTVIVSVVRTQFRMMTPPFMIVYLSLNKTAILDHVHAFDHIVPSLRDLSLTPYAVHFFGWLTAVLAAESLQLVTFYIRTRFYQFYALRDIKFVLSNTVLVTPILHHIFLMSVIRYGFRDINAKVTSIEEWITYRSRWKELRRTAIHLTNTVFGEMIIVFIILTVLEVIFFIFLSYNTYRSGIITETLTYVMMVFARAGLMFQLFRTCRNCKIEVNRSNLYPKLMIGPDS